MKDLDSKIENLMVKLEALKLAKIAALSKEIEDFESDTSIAATIVSAPTTSSLKKDDKVVAKKIQRSPVKIENMNYNVHGFRRDTDGEISYGISVFDPTEECNPRRYTSENLLVKELVSDLWKTNSKLCFKVVTKKHNVSTHETLVPIMNCDVFVSNDGSISRIANVKKMNPNTDSSVTVESKDVPVVSIQNQPLVQYKPALVKPAQPVQPTVIKKSLVMDDKEKMRLLQKTFQSFSLPKNHSNFVNDLVLKRRNFDPWQKAPIITYDDNIVGRIVEVALHTKGPDTLLWENKNKDDSKAFDFIFHNSTIDVKGTFDPTNGNSNSTFERGIFVEAYKLQKMADILMLFSCYEDNFNFNFDCRGWISREDLKDKIERAENGFDKREELIWVKEPGVKYKVKVEALNHL